MNIIVDRSRCTGIGICESLADDYFEVDDNGELILTSGAAVSHEHLLRVREAVHGCPARALTLEDD